MEGPVLEEAAPAAGAAEPALTWEILRTVKLGAVLGRRGRQLTAEVALTTLAGRGGVTAPLVAFSGGWTARLLGYPKKFRGARVVEVFTILALRAYLLLYGFWPLSLAVRGALGNFAPLWRLLNSPSGQIFPHPLTGAWVWDVGLPRGVAGAPEHAASRLLELFADLAPQGAPLPDGAEVAAEASLFAAALSRSPASTVARLHLTWGQVVFFPTLVATPRRTKRARSVRKRLAKRLVRLAGRRFFVG